MWHVAAGYVACSLCLWQYTTGTGNVMIASIQMCVFLNAQLIALV